jgi:hypothetical protein
MPSRPDRDGDHHLNVLDAAWEKTREHWRDDMTRRFDTDYWTPLRSRSRSYLDDLRKLMEFLEAAERDTEY